jgi:glycosyltransferase involved in cell wall biosynthesis
MKLLSVVMPVYNERETLREILEAVLGAPAEGLSKEFIVTDGCSTDGRTAFVRSGRD